MATTSKIINAALSGLSARQKEVLERRFGLSGGTDGEGESFPSFEVGHGPDRSRVAGRRNAQRWQHDGPSPVVFDTRPQVGG